MQRVFVRATIALERSEASRLQGPGSQRLPSVSRGRGVDAHKPRRRDLPSCARRASPCAGRATPPPPRLQLARS